MSTKKKAVRKGARKKKVSPKQKRNLENVKKPKTAEKIVNREAKVYEHQRTHATKISETDKQIIYSLAEQGFTQTQIAERIGVARQSLYNLQQRDAKFLDAFKKAKKRATEIVERSLFESATGWTCEETIVKVIDGNIHKIKVTKQYPPSVDAQKFYLKNRDPDRWKDRLEQDIVSDGKSVAEVLLLAAQARKKANG